MSVRRRDKPLDILKKLPIVRSVHDLSAEDETRIALLSDAELLKAPAVKKKKLNIPIGDVRVDSSYAVRRDYLLPESYVKHTKRIGDEADVTVDYIVEEEDIEWLAANLKRSSAEVSKHVTADTLEMALNLLEKHTGTGDPISMAAAEKFVCASLSWPAAVANKMFPDVYQYWISKRQQLHKPLCRKYWPPTSASDNNPLLVFRPREKERYKLRKHRRNDLSSFRKLQSIRREFAKARVLLQLIHEREMLKKAKLEIQKEIFEQMIYDATNSSEGPPRCPEGTYRHILRYEHLLIGAATAGVDEGEEYEEEQPLDDLSSAGGLKITLKLKSNGAAAQKNKRKSEGSGARQRKRNRASTGAADGNLSWNAADRSATPQQSAQMLQQSETISIVSDLDSNGDVDSRYSDVTVGGASVLPTAWPSFMHPLGTRRQLSAPYPFSSGLGLMTYLQCLEEGEEDVKGDKSESAFVIRSRSRVGRGGRLVVDRFLTRRHQPQCSLLYPTTLQTDTNQLLHQKYAAVAAAASDSSVDGVTAAFLPTSEALHSPPLAAAAAFLSSSRELEILAMSDSEDESVDLPRAIKSIAPWDTSSSNGLSTTGSRTRYVNLTV